ncbi:hypothetical protein EAH89_22175 [Roseomonas nepalensis]|uniref:SH3 domain-containing protein n=1 Tax=Muricoccus nepalensis TaxID=1854500 RepID=A0A502FIG0_9PROT|nr:hypothetical protein [Roseomonas nepalensis]TPG49260.1 hypothetical protein EAH89_22175 [Roseomonas nepalensis]
MAFSTKETELLGHLTRRLGSDHQAEAEAARDRLVQLLGKHGLNFNDYAEWLQSGALAGGHADPSDPERENAELRNEVARLREEAAFLRAEMRLMQGTTGRQLAPIGLGGGAGRPHRHAVAARRSGTARTAFFAVMAGIPIGWLAASLPATRPPGGDGGTSRLAASRPARPARAEAASAELPAPPDGAGWKPPNGSRPAVVLEDGVVLTSPFPSRATEQGISRGSRVAILRQLVANGRQWAEVTSPAASGYIPIDLLEVLDQPGG